MKMIKREGKGPPPRDLLVCFPTRAHLTLMPKPASSPRRHLHHQQKQLRRSMRGSSMGGGGHASPHLWSGTKQMGSDNLSEPTSPKVTCAGQIKVRPSTRSCKNWQTVMEEIERLHNDRKKKPTWAEALGFKKEVMQFLTCLRKLKFDFHCLGSFSHVDITSDDEEEEEEEDKHDKEIKQDQDHHDHENDEELSSRTVFSKWFMVLQENQDCGAFEDTDKSTLKPQETENLPCMPPTNALLLMRCRSAPAKSWMEEKEEEQQQQQHQQHQQKDDENDDHDVDHYHDHKEEEHADKDDHLEKKESKRNSLMELMKNESDFYKLSSDIVKETWVTGGIHKDSLSRSRSWKR